MAAERSLSLSAMRAARYAPDSVLTRTGSSSPIGTAAAHAPDTALATRPAATIHRPVLSRIASLPVGPAPAFARSSRAGAGGHIEAQSMAFLRTPFNRPPEPGDASRRAQLTRLM